MISLPRPLIAVTALGLALVLGSALTRVRAQTQPQNQAQTKDQTLTQATTSPVSPLAAYPLDRLSATRQRPLFSPGRRPPAPPPAPTIAAAPPPPPPQPPKLILFGIVMDADDAHAIVGTGTADKTRRVRIGDDIGGWKVTQIEGRKLVLSLNDRSATFTLFSGQHAGPGNGQPLSAAGRGKKE
jgi:general secretion pathway protein N